MYPRSIPRKLLGEWLVPRGEVLLVSFGAHTVADKDGMAVVKERLAIIEADEATGVALSDRRREPGSVRSSLRTLDSRFPRP